MATISLASTKSQSPQSPTQFWSFIAVTIYINRIEGIWIQKLCGVREKWIAEKTEMKSRKADLTNKQRKKRIKCFIRDGISFFGTLPTNDWREMRENTVTKLKGEKGWTNN